MVEWNLCMKRSLAMIYYIDFCYLKAFRRICRLIHIVFKKIKTLLFEWKFYSKAKRIWECIVLYQKEIANLWCWTSKYFRLYKLKSRLKKGFWNLPNWTFSWAFVCFGMHCLKIDHVITPYQRCVCVQYVKCQFRMEFYCALSSKFWINSDLISASTFSNQIFDYAAIQKI